MFGVGEKHIKTVTMISLKAIVGSVHRVCRLVPREDVPTGTTNVRRLFGEAIEHPAKWGANVLGAYRSVNGLGTMV